MTVREYLERDRRPRYVVAAPTAAESPARELEAVVLSAHHSESAAREAIRWERSQLKRERGDPELTLVRIVVDLEDVLSGTDGDHEGQEQ